VDVGGTSIKAAVIDAEGRTRAEDVRPTPADPAAAVRAVQSIAHRLRDETGPVRAAGVVVPGLVDRAGGIARYSANLGWHEVPLRRLLRDDLDVPVAIDHDARAVALAEYAAGTAAGVDNCCVIVAGTGIAAVTIAGGRLISGAGGAAGELGHLPVAPGGEPCACGAFGCLEAYASSGAISRRYAAATGHRRPAAEIIARRHLDLFAGHVWTEAVRALATAVTGVVMLTDPQLIVLAGTLADSGDALLTPLRAALRDALVWREPPQLVVSRLGGAAGRIGATVLAWEQVPTIRAALPVA
jgi:glucokinase